MMNADACEAYLQSEAIRSNQTRSDAIRRVRGVPRRRLGTARARARWKGVWTADGRPMEGHGRLWKGVWTADRRPMEGGARDERADGELLLRRADLGGGAVEGQ